MNLSWIDWAIMAVAVVALRLASMSTRKYVKGVADFLSANRSAGRYLLTIASGMGSMGVVSFVAGFEVGYQAGFPPQFWSMMGIPVATIIILTGWVFYRFRETRALTMAQFLEMRYNRRFRIFAGSLCWVSGLLNFGIFPAVAARFLIYFCGLPEQFIIPGLSLHLSTFPVIMALDLGLALIFVNMGGQVSVMVTECFQGIFCTLAFVVVAAAVLVSVSWSQIVEALNMAQANASLLHPFHTSQVKDFNVWFYLIGVFAAFYSYMSWQGTSGFNSSARTPHEQKMGQIISLWRYLPMAAMTMLLPVATYAILHLPEFSSKAAIINQSLQNIDSTTIQGQMRVPIAMAHFLPIGVKGLLATVMLFFSFTCHDTYMHSWGSIFIQDVYMPIRNRPMDPQKHIKFLRWSIVGVAVFAFIFSLFYNQTQKIFMFQAITGTIWLGGSGIVIIGGLYWKRGTTAAAYTALIFGAVMGVAGLIIPDMYKNHFHRDFPINSQFLYLFAILGAVLLYFVVSMITSRNLKEFNLLKMLHRADMSDEKEIAPRETLGARWQQIVGITDEFRFTDKILAVALLIWNLGWFAAFVVLSVVNLMFKVPTSWWAEFWHILILTYFALGIPITIWFAIGGIKDIKALFRTLSAETRDHTDDGRVLHKPEFELNQVTEFTEDKRVEETAN